MSRSRFKRTILFVVPLLCVVIPTLARYEPSSNCERISNNETTNKAVVSCSLRLLDSEGSNLSSLQQDGTSRLSIICNSDTFVESSVPPSINRLVQLEELSIDHCKVLKLSPLSFDGLRELKKLSINTYNKEWGPTRTLDLIFGSLSGLKELQILDFGSSNIRTVPDDAYCSLTNLQSLNMSDNRLRDIDKIGFGARSREKPMDCPGGLDIRNLDLSFNDLRVLKNDSDLTKLRRLQVLQLQHNEISELGGSALSGLVSLRVFNMSYNRLQKLPPGIFSSSRELREIYLQNNTIYELSTGIFHSLEQLLVLDLSNNELSNNHIDDDTFVGLIRLIVLNLSNNSLTRVDGKTFKDLYFLQILDLHSNSISFVQDNAFLPLYNLHTLNLAENRLHSIEAQLFNGLFVLSKLSLNSNLIKNVDRLAFKNCSDLKELDLSNNALSEVPESLADLAFLKTLDLGENRINGLRNGSFKGLSQLNGLRLIENNIGNLSKGMFFDLPNLHILNLAKNKIQQIEIGTFEHNIELEAIRLDGNFISEINGVFSTLQSLMWLNLSENHIVWFDYAFVPLNLEWLDIKANFIERLENYYGIQALHIKTLDASYNKITDISPIGIPNSVELLFINNNLITNVHPNTFHDKLNLGRVDMYSNKILKLDLKALRLKEMPENRTLPGFYIAGNPFHCDCTMDWLPMINNMGSSRQYPEIKDLQSVVCKMSYSRGSTDVPALETKSSDFLCKYETHCFTLCHCCDFDACDCEMTCPQNCSCYHDQTWNTNVVDCSNRHSNIIPSRIPMDANEVYLDGNSFVELQNHVFIGRKNMRVLYVNSSHVQSIQNRTFNGLNALHILHLEDNELDALKGFEFEHLVNLKELYLQNNRISHIGNMTLLPLRSLEILRLEGNRLNSFPVWQLTLNTYLAEVTLSGNPWSCRCKFLQELNSWLSDNRRKVSDSNEISCQDGSSSQKRTLNLNSSACSDYLGSSVIQRMMVSDFWLTVVLPLATFLLIIFLLLILFICRDSLKVWIHSKFGVRICNSKGAGGYEDNEKLFDGYFIYSPKDEESLVNLVSELGSRGPTFTVMLHYKDLSSHPTGIVEAAEMSRRVIVYLTRNFIQTEWSRCDFRQAFHEALKGRSDKLVLVEEECHLQKAEVDQELELYLKTGVRVRYGEKRFWERLRYAMPNGSSRHHAKSINYRRNINNYTLDSSRSNNHSYQDKTRRPHPSLPLQTQVNSHPLFKATNGDIQQPPAYTAHAPPQHELDEANYSSATTATPSPKPSHRHHPPVDSRPNSEHIYSSIDSDYSTLERNFRRTNVVPPPRAPRRPQNHLEDFNGAYLV